MAHDPPVTPGEWYLLQLFVQGNEGLVRVNGKTVARTDRLSIIRDGHIALQMHREDSTIRFQGVRVRKLSDGEGAGRPAASGR